MYTRLAWKSQKSSSLCLPGLTFEKPESRLRVRLRISAIARHRRGSWPDTIPPNTVKSSSFNNSKGVERRGFKIRNLFLSARVVAHTCTLSLQEAEAEDLGI